MDSKTVLTLDYSSDKNQDALNLLSHFFGGGSKAHSKVSAGQCCVTTPVPLPIALPPSQSLSLRHSTRSLLGRRSEGMSAEFSGQFLFL